MIFNELLIVLVAWAIGFAMGLGYDRRNRL